jgi:glycosyltransferase involved in cell wall biosynthesis
VSLARHEPQKRLGTLIDAMALVQRHLPNARLLIAGRQGRDTPRLEAALRGAGVDPEQVLLGAYDKVPELLCAADLFVLPTMREGMPGAIIEALALETPIIASDIPSVREVVDESVASLVPIGGPGELAESVVATLADREGLAVRAAAGRRRFEGNFTIERSAERWSRFYRSVLQGARATD